MDSDESESDDEAPADSADNAAAPTGGFSLAAIAGDMEMDELDIPLNTTASALAGTSSALQAGS
ncbi:UNVERIFIED_CONTAM: hypothetical protein NY603_21510, partial [Bacteroidetes bacterium 56_B9]